VQNTLPPSAEGSLGARASHARRADATTARAAIDTVLRTLALLSLGSIHLPRDGVLITRFRGW
jgi:hypothetical protein